MRDSRSTAFRAIAAVLASYLAFFAFLSADVIVRVYEARRDFQSPTDAAVLMVLELARCSAILVTLVLSLRLLRGARRPDARLFTFASLMLGIWFAKITAFGGFPGHAQEWMANALLAAGSPRALLKLVFGAPIWSVWLALGAVLRLSVTWPRSLQPSVIEHSGDTDRSGMMRGVALAGTDVGLAFRRLAARLVERRTFRPAFVWPVAVVAGLAHASAGSALVRVAFDAFMAVLLALGITNLRAAQSAAGERTRRRLLWVTQAGLTAASAFLLVGMLSLRHDGGTAAISLGISIVAPFAVLMSLGSAVLGKTVTDPRPALRRTIEMSIAGVLGVVVYLLIQLALRPMAGQAFPIVEVTGALSGAGLIAATRTRWRGIAEQFVGRPDVA